TVDAFKTELEAIRTGLESKKLQPAEAEKRIEKAVQDHGWAHAAMRDLRDAYEIDRDPKDLAPLLEAYKRQTQYKDPKGKFFAQNLFFNQPAERWKQYTAQELTAFPSLESTEKKNFLYWKTEDRPAKVLTFAEARPQVEAAWRLEKARALAKAKADE